MVIAGWRVSTISRITFAGIASIKRYSRRLDVVEPVIANRLIYMVPRDGIEPPTRGFSVLFRLYSILILFVFY